jgi:hypothetical protein
MKTSATWVASLLLAGFVHAQTNMVGPNMVGYVKVALTANQMQLIAMPFNPVNSGTNNTPMTLDQILGTNNLTAYYEPFDADNIYLWTGTNYLSAWLADNGWGDPGGVDWKWGYFDPNTGYPALCATNSDYDVTIGQGMWLLHRNTATTICLTGAVPEAPVTTNLITAGAAMVANPYPVIRTLDQLIGTIITGTTAYYEPFDADNIFLWTGTNYLSAWLADDGWGDPGVNWKWVYFDPNTGYPALCATNTNFNINPGQGMWYIPRGGAFEWPVIKPY